MKIEIFLPLLFPQGFEARRTEISARIKTTLALHVSMWSDTDGDDFSSVSVRKKRSTDGADGFAPTLTCAQSYLSKLQLEKTQNQPKLFSVCVQAGFNRTSVVVL